MFEAIWGVIEPRLVEMFSMAILALLGWVGSYIGKAAGAHSVAAQAAAEAVWREALQSALTTGARSFGGDPQDIEGAIEYMVSYALRSVPESIEKLGGDREILTALARSKLSQLMGR